MATPDTMTRRALGIRRSPGTPYRSQRLKTFHSRVINYTRDLLTREALADTERRTKDGDRRVTEVLGYHPQSPGYSKYLGHYRRNGLAKRAASLPVNSSWDRRLALVSDQNASLATDFEYIQKEHGLIRTWRWADTQLNFGNYSVILLGLDDGKELSEPAFPLAEDPGKKPPAPNGKATPDKLIYMKVFGQPHADIHTWDRDPQSRRYGQPEVYKLKVAHYAGSEGKAEKLVHWSRVIHFSDESLDNEIIGRPRMEVLLDHIEDLTKVVGASAEAFWQVALNPLVYELNENAALPDDEDFEQLESDVEAMFDAVNRVIQISGGKVSRLAGSPSDPRGVYEVLLSLIAAATGIPVRILVGSERGELASTQDRENMAETIDERRTSFCEPVMVRPTARRLMYCGIISYVDDYDVKWPPSLVLSAEIKAKVAKDTAEAMNKLSGGAPSTIASPQELRAVVWLPPEMDSVEDPSLIENEDDPDVADQMARGVAVRRA